MDPVSGVDRLIHILRRRLEERARSARSGVSPAGADRKERAQEPAGVSALALRQDIDDAQLGRALIESMLADQFGASLLNDAQFQLVVKRVTEALGEDLEGGRLIATAIENLRTS